MLALPEKLQRAISYFSRLPGVGEKTATRQSLILSNWRQEDLEAFAASIKDLSYIEKCPECGLFSDEGKCFICESEVRYSAHSICVVENITDAIAIEKSGQFQGLFHVLGGVLNPLAGVGPKDIRVDELISRIQNNEVTEVILAINPSVEGDATCSYIKGELKNSNVRTERIGLGIPIGGSLEYLDSQTIGKALENRKVF